MRNNVIEIQVITLNQTFIRELKIKDIKPGALILERLICVNEKVNLSMYLSFLIKYKKCKII